MAFHDSDPLISQAEAGRWTQEASSAGVPLTRATVPKFFEGFAERLRVPDDMRDVQVFDEYLPGFVVRKFASGRASYFVASGRSSDG